MNILMQMVFADTGGEAPPQADAITVSENGDLFASLFPGMGVKAEGPVPPAKSAALPARAQGDVLIALLPEVIEPSATVADPLPRDLVDAEPPGDMAGPEASSDGDVPAIILPGSPDVMRQDARAERPFPDARPPMPVEAKRLDRAEPLLPAAASPVAVPAVAASRPAGDGLPPATVLQNGPVPQPRTPDPQPGVARAPFQGPPVHADPKGLAAPPPASEKSEVTPARASARIPVAVPAQSGAVPTALPVRQDAEAVPTEPLDAPDPAIPTVADRPERTVAQAPNAGVVVRPDALAEPTGADSDSAPRDRRAPVRKEAAGLPTTPATAQSPSRGGDQSIAGAKAVPGFALGQASAGEQAEPVGASRDILPSVASGHPSSHHLSPVAEIRGAVAAADASPRPVVAQIAHAIMRSRSDGVVEVRLQPEELGRVRLSILPAELGHTVSVTAERPETLDLIRRHIDILATDLRDRGFGSLNFSFSGGAGHSHADKAGREAAASDPGEIRKPGLDADVASERRRVDDGRLDLRM